METKNNSGAIFRNDKKDKPSAPDYTGSARINDQEFKLSAWINKSRDGKSYLRILFATKDQVNVETQIVDDLPF